MQSYWLPACVFSTVLEYSTDVNAFNVAMIWGNSDISICLYFLFVGFNLYQVQ